MRTISFPFPFPAEWQKSRVLSLLCSLFTGSHTQDHHTCTTHHNDLSRKPLHRKHASRAMVYSLITRSLQSLMAPTRAGSTVYPATTRCFAPGHNHAPAQINTRGRPQKRLTSSKRVSQHRRSKKLIHRKPLTPTTKTAMAKERQHRRYEKKRATEAEAEKILRTPSTYWRVLRDGKKYRSFGGTRVR